MGRLSWPTIRWPAYLSAAQRAAFQAHIRPIQKHTECLPRLKRADRIKSTPGDGPETGRLSVGHGPTRLKDTICATNGAPVDPQLSSWATSLGRGAAPVWCHPRRREATPRASACLARGRPPTEARPVVAHPRLSAGSIVVSPGAASADGPRAARDTADDDSKHCAHPLTSAVISTLGISRGGRRERSGRCTPSPTRLYSARSLRKPSALRYDGRGQSALSEALSRTVRDAALAAVGPHARPIPPTPLPP
jgi:hypothetical protein